MSSAGSMIRRSLGKSYLRSDPLTKLTTYRATSSASAYSAPLFTTFTKANTLDVSPDLPATPPGMQDGSGIPVQQQRKSSSSLEIFTKAVIPHHQDPDVIRETHVEFTGYPFTRTDKSSEVVLVSDLFDSNSSYYKLHTADVALVEPLSLVSTAQTTHGGVAGRRCALYVKPGAGAIFCQPFKVGEADPVTAQESTKVAWWTASVQGEVVNAAADVADAAGTTTASSSSSHGRGKHAATSPSSSSKTSSTTGKEKHNHSNSKDALHQRAPGGNKGAKK